jgi:hypothetical protein
MVRGLPPETDPRESHDCGDRSLPLAILEDAPQPLGRGGPDGDQAALFKHRDLAIRCPQIVVVEDPDMRQFADGALQIRKGARVAGDEFWGNFYFR